MTQIQIVAIGGSTRVESSTELALRIAGRAAERAGAAVTYVTGPDLICQCMTSMILIVNRLSRISLKVFDKLTV